MTEVGENRSSLTQSHSLILSFNQVFCRADFAISHEKGFLYIRSDRVQPLHQLEILLGLSIGPVGPAIEQWKMVTVDDQKGLELFKVFPPFRIPAPLGNRDGLAMGNIILEAVVLPVQEDLRSVAVQRANVKRKGRNRMGNHVPVDGRGLVVNGIQAFPQSHVVKHGRENRSSENGFKIVVGKTITNPGQCMGIQKHSHHKRFDTFPMGNNLFPTRTSIVHKFPDLKLVKKMFDDRKTAQTPINNLNFGRA